MKKIDEELDLVAENKTLNDKQRIHLQDDEEHLNDKQRLKDDEQRLKKDERETILSYNEADGFWNIYSAVQHHIRKFDKLGYEVTDVDSYQDGNVAAKYYKVPKRAISFRSPVKATRVMSEEQKREFTERMKKGKM